MVLLQQFVPPEWKSAAYASRAMSDTKQRYSQVEKEALALVWASEKFSDYIVGKRIQLETNHKPLVPLLSTTHLDHMLPRVLRFRLCLTQFDCGIEHVLSKLLYAADALSLASDRSEAPSLEYPDTELSVQALVAYLPADADRLETYRQAQKANATCSKLLQYCQNGWPSKHQVKGDVTPYTGG